MEKEIATVGDMHVCPMVTGTVPHAGGPIIGPGCPGVTINGKPVALMDDACACAGGTPDTIVTGCSGVTINGVPVATVGDVTAHGGVIVKGCPGVTITQTTPRKPAVITVKRIPFPDTSLLDRIKSVVSGNGSQLKKAKAKQQEIKELAEAVKEEPGVYNLQWIRKKVSIEEGHLREVLILHADTYGYEEGETAKISVRYSKEGKEFIEEVSGVVTDGCIEVEWKVDEEKIDLQ